MLETTSGRHRDHVGKPQKLDVGNDYRLMRQIHINTIEAINFIIGTNLAINVHFPVLARYWSIIQIILF